MKRFRLRFTVHAPLTAVAEFHKDTRALRELTPLPMGVTFYYFVDEFARALRLPHAKNEEDVGNKKQKELITVH